MIAGKEVLLETLKDMKHLVEVALKNEFVDLEWIADMENCIRTVRRIWEHNQKQSTKELLQKLLKEKP